MPTGLTATPVSATRIDLTWAASSDSVGVAGYRVFRNDAAAPLATVTTTSHSDTTVSPGTAYSYYVVAFDAANNASTPSTTSAATTPAPPPVATAGLDARPANTSCLAWDRPTAGSSISLARYTDLAFASPVAMLQAPNDASRWFIVEQAGAVRQFSTATPTASSVFIDITSRVRSGGEMGLLGMAFHPDFPSDPRVFLSYTSGTNPLVSRIAVFRSADQGKTLDPASEQPLLTVNQPQDNHNGGHIAFGPDGYLYIGFGDGGGAGDQHGDPGNGQRMTTLLGKMLRIDVDSAAPYAIPATNPHAANPVCPAAGRASGACPEIYASGFRNPWRWSFDRNGGALWVADVGQGQWEEVNEVGLGGNYGWRCREGAHDFNSGNTSGCSAGGLIDPVTEYQHALGNSITGGYVYRGPENTSLSGRYLFADFGSGRIWAWIAENASAPRTPTQLLDTSLNVSAFGEAQDGELFVVHYGGSLHRIVFHPATGGGVPRTLSATGCVAASDARLPAAGLIPYDVNAPFWSDGAVKDRWLALPDGQNITVASSGDWELPNRSVLMKTFRFGTQLVETRLLMRHADGTWGGFTYAWNAQQTDADLVEGGATRDISNGRQWIFPSESQCLECHTSVAGRALGLETSQLNRDLTYPQTGRTANQLFTLNHIGVLSPPMPDPTAQPVMPDPAGTALALSDRARAYLHTNCAQCHQPGGPTPSTIDLRFATPLAATNTCNALPQSGDMGIGAAARIIAPGAATNSVLVNRVNRRDAHAMPPLGSAVVDAEGVALLTQWIDALSGC